MWAVFRITDGTPENTVDLLAQGDGVNLIDWQPGIPTAKDSGTVWRSSPLSDGRRLISRPWSSGFETMTIAIKGGSSRRVVKDTRLLTNVLIKAFQHWTTKWQYDEVWLEVRGQDEDNSLYAIIKDWGLANFTSRIDSPHAVAAWMAAQPQISLSIERDHWTANQPGTGTATPISAVETFNNVPLGNVDESGERDTETAFSQVFLANKHNIANITHIFVNGAGANLIDAAVYPLNIFAAAPSDGDATYFGSSNAVTDYGPFCSLVFDIATAATYGAGDSAKWQYWNGAWTDLTYWDNTAPSASQDEPLSQTGVNSVHWAQPEDWSTNGVNGVTGYWVRVLLSETTAITTPTQQNRKIYSVPWGYTEIQEDVVGGDINSLARVVMENVSEGNYGAQVLYTGPSRMLIGTRSVDRGENFTPWLMMDQETSAYTSLLPDAPATRATRSESPCGVAYCTPGTNIPTSFGDVGPQWYFYEDYFGTFAVYARVYDATAYGGNVVARTAVGYSTSMDEYTVYGEEVELENANSRWEVMELGRITIPPSDTLRPADVALDGILTIQLKCTSAISTGNFYLYDVFLLPVDECAGNFFKANSTDEWRLVSGRALDVDSVSFQRELIRTHYYVVSTGVLAAPYVVEPTGDRFTLQAGSQQRIWAMTMYWSDYTSSWRSRPWDCSCPVVRRNDRYLLARGDE